MTTERCILQYRCQQWTVSFNKGKSNNQQDDSYFLSVYHWLPRDKIHNTRPVCDNTCSYSWASRKLNLSILVSIRGLNRFLPGDLEAFYFIVDFISLHQWLIWLKMCHKCFSWKPLSMFPSFIFSFVVFFFVAFVAAQGSVDPIQLSMKKNNQGEIQHCPVWKGAIETTMNLGSLFCPPLRTLFIRRKKEATRRHLVKSSRTAFFYADQGFRNGHLCHLNIKSCFFFLVLYPQVKYVVCFHEVHQNPEIQSVCWSLVISFSIYFSIWIVA